MTTQRKWVLGFVVLLVAGAMGVLVDSWADKAAERGRELDVQYGDLIYAKVKGQAGEQPPGHPMYELYRERHDALVKAGYLKTREFPMRHGFESRKASRDFFYQFATNFPGVDVQIRGQRDQPPVIVVCARDRDLLAIKWFIMQQDAGK